MTNLLREKVNAPLQGDANEWLQGLRREFERYRAHFVQQMALEEKKGYLEPVIEHRPSLGGEVDRLKHQHTEITQLMACIYQDVCEMTPDECLRARDCCGRIQNLLAFVEEHEEQEDLLLSEVFSQDIGTSGH